MGTVVQYFGRGLKSIQIFILYGLAWVGFAFFHFVWIAFVLILDH
jgi:hypothetical protein